MTNSMKLSQSLIPVVRRKMLADQGGLCVLCKKPIKEGQGTTAVLDHDHATGHVRGVLHRGCNAMLGHLENNRPRHQLTDPATFREYLSNIADYIEGDYGHQPLHSTHKSAEEKKAASYEKSRKKLLKARTEKNPAQADALKAKEKALRAARANRNRPKVKEDE